MGSVVLNAVNSLFSNPTRQSEDAYRESLRQREQHSPLPRRRSQTSSRSRTRTPDIAQQQNSTLSAASSREETMSDQHGAMQSSTDTQGSRIASRPPSPPLAARQAPPSSSEVQSIATGSDAVTSTLPERHAKKVKIRDLQHIQEFACEDMLSFSEIRSRSRSRSRGGSVEEEGPQYDISGMKVEEIIEMVARLLTKITATNDRQHEHLHRQPPSIDSASHLNPQTSSVLAFHGKNVPSITILSYLSRINKYCPTSYEVFLALLVYFDRMTERVNAGPMQSLREANRQAEHQQRRSSPSSSTESFPSDKMEGVTVHTPSGAQLATPPSSGSMEHGVQSGVPGTPHSRPNPEQSPAMSPALSGIDSFNLSHFFVVDSFNIHRLVIAGVTCASKFFSDIFYTNSRYAKVGGLPLAELNHLELQFLILNDFRLSIPVEEIEAYGTMLVEFYAREVVAQRQAAAMQMRSLSESSSDSTSTVRAAG